MADRLRAAGPRLTARAEAQASACSRQLRTVGAGLLADARRVVTEGAGRLEALSPLAVIARGYAMAQDADGHVVSSVRQAHAGDALSVRVSDGVLACEVREALPSGQA